MTSDRFPGAFDAVLHLLDRQVLDVEGRMVCKVDDVALAELDDGGLALTALLSGPPALVPRYADDGLGRRLHQFWRRLSPARADRDDPCQIDLALVDRLGSGVELSVPREGLLRPRRVEGHRLDDLLQLTVTLADDRPAGRVLDVRVRHSGDGPEQHLRVTGLVVGRHGRPGSYLGYDRRGDMGPWIVNRAVRALHRRSGYVSTDDVDEIDWAAGTVRVRASELGALGPA